MAFVKPVIVDKVTKATKAFFENLIEGIEESKAAAATALTTANTATATAAEALVAAGSAVSASVVRGFVSLANAPRMVGVSLATAATLTNPRAVATSPDSRFVYVLNYSSGKISVYLKGPLGDLVLIQEIATGTEPSCIAITKSGKFLFVGDYGAETIHQYVVNRSTGELTANAAATVATGPKTTAIAIGPDDAFAYSVTEGTHTIYQWKIAASGALEALATPTVVPTQTFLQDVCCSSDNAHVYVLSSGSGVTLAYKKEAGGLLKGNEPLTEGVEAGATKMALSEDGLTMLVTCATAGKLVLLARTPASGNLAKSATTYAVAKAQAVAISSDGRSVACTSFTESLVAQFSRELSGGAYILTPSPTPTQTTGTKPRACTYTADGRVLLVVNEGSNSIQRHERFVQASVATSYVTNDAAIELTAQDENVKGRLRVGTVRSPGVSFFVICDDPAATGYVGWAFPEPGQVLTYQRFTASSMPPAAWTPYSTASLWNKPVPATPEVHPDSAAIVKLLLEDHAAPQPGNMVIRQSYPVGANKDFNKPLYWASLTDEEYTVKLVGFSKGGALEGAKLKAPAYIKPANGSDAHMTIVTPDGWEYDFWNSKVVGKVIEAEAASKTAVAGEGRGSATAADFANLAGVIRPEELIGGAINHALFCLLPKVTDSLAFGHEIKKEGGAGSGCYVWPAVHAGGGQSKAEEEAAEALGRKLPPMGVRLWLAMTFAELEAIANIKPWELTIGKAMIRYGGYGGDRSGGGFGFQFLSERSYVAPGVVDPLYKYAEEAHALPNPGIAETTEEGIPTFVFKPAERIPWATKLRVLVPPSKSEPI